MEGLKVLARPVCVRTDLRPPDLEPSLPPGNPARREAPVCRGQLCPEGTNPPREFRVWR